MRDHTTHAAHDRAADEVVAWYARLTGGEVTAADRMAFRAWLATDPSHEEAYRRLTTVLGLADVALSGAAVPAEIFEATAEHEGESVVRDRHTLPQRERRSWFRPPAMALKALAASIALAVMIGSVFLMDQPAYTMAATAVGERRTVRLADGSTVYLNTDTRLSFAIDENARRVRFDEGEAYFEIAADAARPFVIAVGDRQVQVVGTAFSIRHLETRTDVAVTEGIVNLSDEVGPMARIFLPDTSRQLTAGMAASYVPNAGIVIGPPVTASVVAPWRRGQLIYRGERLAAVIADLDRYFTDSVVVRDAAAADLKVSAVINLGTEDAVLTTLASQLPIRVERSGNRVEVSLRQ